MADTPNAPFESRMLIDGKLVDGEAGTFSNINPANEDVLGEVADASKADMNRAIDAARRSFDETDWSTNHQLRKRCLEQLHEAIESELEELREELIREVGCPRAVTYGAQLDAPLQDGLKYPARLIETFPWETDLGDAFVSLTGRNTRRKVWHEPVGVVGPSCRGTSIRSDHQQARSSVDAGTCDPQTGAQHTVQRNEARAADRRKDRHPSGCGQCRDCVGPLRRRGADAVAEG
jgi:hypothetical protein